MKITITIDTKKMVSPFFGVGNSINEALARFFPEGEDTCVCDVDGKDQTIGKITGECLLNSNCNTVSPYETALAFGADETDIDEAREDDAPGRAWDLLAKAVAIALTERFGPDEWGEDGKFPVDWDIDTRPDRTWDVGNVVNCGVAKFFVSLFASLDPGGEGAETGQGPLPESAEVGGIGDYLDALYMGYDGTRYAVNDECELTVW